MGSTYADAAKLSHLREINQNTKKIAEQLNRLNGMLELIYKNGITMKADD